MPNPTNLVQAIDRLIKLFGGSGESGSLLHGITRIGDALERNPVLSNSHSDLDNLDADDHPHYHTDDRGDARYYPRSELDLKLTPLTATGHNHPNLVNLNSINQNLSTADNPRFNNQTALALDYSAADNDKVLGVTAGTLSWVDGGGGATSVNAGVAVFSDTVGGAFTAGAWRTRTLNLHEGDTSFATLANNTVTITNAGTYLLLAEGWGFLVERHQMRIVVGADNYYGTVGTSFYNFVQGSPSRSQQVVSVASGSSVRLEHRCESSHVEGYGRVGPAWASGQKYAYLTFMRIS